MMPEKNNAKNTKNTKNKWITHKQCPSTETKLACDTQNYQSSLSVMTETRKSDKQCKLQPVCFRFFLFFTYASRPPLALLAPPHCPLFVRPITAGRSRADSRLCITVSRGRFIKKKKRQNKLWVLKLALVQLSSTGSFCLFHSWCL